MTLASCATRGCCDRTPHGPADLHTDPLYRVLRAAVNFGVLAVAPGTPPRFEHTEGSRQLMDSHPATIWPMARPVHADMGGSGVIWHAHLACEHGRKYAVQSRLEHTRHVFAAKQQAVPCMRLCKGHIASPCLLKCILSFDHVLCAL